MQFIVSGQRIAVENFVTGKLYTILWKNDTQVTLTCISIGADCVVFQGEAPLNLFTLTMQNADTIDTIEPTQLGTTNYNNLINKPSINGVDLIGNKTSSDLGIREVPAVIETDEGKVLTADDDGTYSWQELPEGTTDYTQLNNKPQINSVTLTGNVSLEDLGAAAAADIPTTPTDIGAEPAITSENMLDADLVDDSNSTNKFATAAQLAQIATNETNISSCKAFTDNASIDSNRKLYISATEPTGDIPQGSTWIDGKTIKSMDRTDNLFNYRTMAVGTEDYFLTSDGNMTSNTSWVITDYIPVDTLSTTLTLLQSGTTPAYCGYDENKQYITGVAYSNQTQITLTATETMKYIRFSWRRGPYMPDNAETIMLNSGATAEQFVPYLDWQ